MFNVLLQILIKNSINEDNNLVDKYKNVKKKYIYIYININK